MSIRSELQATRLAVAEANGKSPLEVTQAGVAAFDFIQKRGASILGTLDAFDKLHREHFGGNGHPGCAAHPSACELGAWSALELFVRHAEEVDLGHGDGVVTTCESLAAAKAALQHRGDSRGGEVDRG